MTLHSFLSRAGTERPGSTLGPAFMKNRMYAIKAVKKNRWVIHNHDKDWMNCWELSTTTADDLTLPILRGSNWGITDEPIQALIWLNWIRSQLKIDCEIVKIDLVQASHKGKRRTPCD